MNKKLLIKLFQDFMKRRGLELLKVLGMQIIKDSLNYILSELKKKKNVENISASTAAQFNMPYDLAFDLVMYVKKYFKL